MGAGQRGGAGEAEDFFGKCSSVLAVVSLLRLCCVERETTTPKNPRAWPGSPCAVGAALYPIRLGEGDVTCELVTYERL